jgi:hypothetical protein
MPFTKRLSKKSKAKRGGSVAANLFNEVTSYDIIVEVGTPAQTVDLQLDTGSSDLWVLAPGACDTGTCTCPSGGCTYCMYIGLMSPTPSMHYISLQRAYGHLLSKKTTLINSYCNIVDLTQSSTALPLNVPFDFQYGSGEVVGEYITENIAVGGASLTDVIVGVASGDSHESRGILGVGLPGDEAAGIPEHAGVLELLVSQGYISSTSYSLYLDSYSKLSLDSPSLMLCS